MVEHGQKRKDREGNGEQEVWEQAEEEEAEEETEDNEHEEDSKEEANTIQVREKGWEKEEGVERNINAQAVA